MSNSVRAVLAQAMHLPPKERAEIATELLHSLDDAVGSPEEGYEQAWSAEIARRVDEIDRGEASLVDAAEALNALRAKYVK